MFSTQERCLYYNNQLGDVICQLRFPEILSIGTTVPAAFQDAIREDFPQYFAKNEMPAPKLTGTPGNFAVENQPGTINYHFISEDGKWRVNLTSKFISLACSEYVSWEEFARKLDKPLVAFIKLYKPAYFERVGLRYLNFISRKALHLESVPFRELINPIYLGPLADEEVKEGQAGSCKVEVDLPIRGGCRAKIHAGPGLVNRNGKQDPDLKFIFDQDLYMPGKVPVKMISASLSTLHGQAFSIFRDAITDTLHDALSPHDL